MNHLTLIMDPSTIALQEINSWSEITLDELDIRLATFPVNRPYQQVIERSARTGHLWQDLDATLHTYCLEQWKRAPQSLTIPSGNSVVLASATSQGDPLTPQIIKTENLDEYKRWIGLRNDAIEAGLYLPVDTFDPTLPLDHLSRLYAAMRAYVFGNSRQLGALKPELERCCGPFPVAVYVARRILIEDGGELILRDMPTLLLCEELIIASGGTFKVSCPAKILVGTLQKLMDGNVFSQQGDANYVAGIE